MTSGIRRVTILILSVFGTITSPAQLAEKHATQNVIFVMTDGLRWQEVFRGAESSLLAKKYKVKDEGALKKAYWRETPQARP